ncbi:cobyrinate a,c-diamide synthase [Thalassotalea ganghwensis]
MNNIAQPLFVGKAESGSGDSASCPALLIAAPHSGTGKTTITAAIARYHRNQGKKVTVFKVGPDFIDPMILHQASDEAVYQLDLWLVGEQGCQQLLFQAAQQSDLILIEGVMGLFDGTPSSADLACYFNIPVLGVIDAKAMAQTFAAVSFGLAKCRQSLPFAGVFANRVNSERHEELLQEQLTPDITYLGRLPSDPLITLPERHLGLVQARELSSIDEQLEGAALYIGQTKLATLPKPVTFTNVKRSPSDVDLTTLLPLSGLRIIVVNDEAFGFIYAANIELLKSAGAELVFCSAIADKHLPDGDVLYIPGGYPELFAKQLAENTSFISDIQAFTLAGKRIVAECGGMLYLLDELVALDGDRYEFCKVIPGQAQMQKNLAAIGSQWVDLASFIGKETRSATMIKGHSYHYSKADIALTPIALSTHYPSNRTGESVYFHHNVIASYIHWYFPSNPAVAIAMFQ